MFPMTVTIHTTAQLKAVMAVLNIEGDEPARIPPCAGYAAETAKEEIKGKATAAKKEATKPEAKPEAQATAETTQAAEQKPETLTQMTAGEAEKALHGHADRPADAPTYQATADAVTKLAREKGRDAAIAVLTKFGAAKLPDVKPEQFAAVIAACSEA